MTEGSPYISENVSLSHTFAQICQHRSKKIFSLPSDLDGLVDWVEKKKPKTALLPEHAYAKPQEKKKLLLCCNRFPWPNPSAPDHARELTVQKSARDRVIESVRPFRDHDQATVFNSSWEDSGWLFFTGPGILISPVTTNHFFH